jgi:hypothetical protein
MLQALALAQMPAICDNYLSVQQDILETFVDRGQLRKLTEPTVLPSGKRIPGALIDRDVATANVNQVLIGGAVLGSVHALEPCIGPHAMQAE